MYSIVRTFEAEGPSAGRPVLIRIHSGETECLEHYWAEWNSKNPDKRRRDVVIESGIASLSGAVSRLKCYC